MSEIEVRGASELARKLQSFTTGSVLTEVADVVQPGLVMALRLAAPKHRGRLAERIRAERHSNLGTGASVEIAATTDVPYAKYVIEGTGVYAGHQAWTIFPRSAKALSWMNQMGDQVFAASVRHQGSRPNPFPRRVWVGLREPVMMELVARVRLRFGA